MPIDFLMCWSFAKLAASPMCSSSKPAISDISCYAWL
jgi:hypothetical protein